ncbi:MAG: PEP-CTERM sorting domain-containing protein [Candidatus Sulfotelmatobacter sp.]
MSDPAAGNVPVVKRRISRRHRRNRRIRRWLAAFIFALFIGSVSTVALRYLSPSLFQAQNGTPPSFEEAELSRNRLVTFNQFLTQAAAPSPDRPVYPYSLVPGGVQDAKELKWVAEHDPIVAAHYAGFDYDHARIVRLTLAQTVYLSYRIGNHVYWTRHRVTLHKGEKVITDGRMTARGRCANRVEVLPQQAVSPFEPPAEKFDEPLPAGAGTAMHAPPVPFESALLNRPAMAGGPTGPLSLYDPLVSGAFVTIYPPPLPAGLCGVKKNGVVDTSGCCPGAESVNPKKKGCSSGVVPEPGTWVLFASGLAVICSLGRRKLYRA